MILDATPLIHLAKAGYLNILKNFKGLAIPEEVYFEVVVRGRPRPDALLVESLIKEGTISVVTAKGRFLEEISGSAAGRNQPLQAGEAAVLALAKERGDIAIVDEAPGRIVGRAFGIEVRGTMYLFALLFRKNLIKKKQLLDALDNLVSSGWRLSPEDYIGIRSHIQGLE